MATGHELELEQLGQRIDRSATFSLDDLEPIYEHLRAENVPTKTPPSLSDKKAIDYALPSLMVLGLACRRHLRALKGTPLEHKAVELWPDVWRWINFMFTRCGTMKSSYGPHYHKRFLRVIPMVLVWLAPNWAMQQEMGKTPGFLPTVTTFWLKEEELFAAAREPPPNFAHTFGGFINSFLMHKENEGRQEYVAQILEGAGGDAKVLARKLLKRFRKLLGKRKPDPGDIYCQIAILEKLSYPKFEETHAPLVHDGLLPDAVRALDIVSSYPPSKPPFVQLAVLACIRCVVDGLCTDNAVQLLESALDAGLLAAVVKAAPLVEEIDEEDERAYCCFCVAKILPRFLMHRSLLRSVEKGLSRATTPSSSRAVAIPGSGAFGHAWQAFVATARVRLALRDAYDEHLVAKKMICSRAGCERDYDPEAAKSCSGCEMVMYCSPWCQKNDWQNHRRDCRERTKGLKSGKSVELSFRDRGYIRFVANHDFSEHQDELLGMAREQKIPPNAKDVVVDFDYTIVPLKLSVKRNRDLKDGDEVADWVERMKDLNLQANREPQGISLVTRAIVTMGATETVSLGRVTLQTLDG